MSTALQPSQATLTRYVKTNEMSLKRGLLLFVQDLQRNGWWIVKNNNRWVSHEEVTEFINQFVRLHQ